MQKTPRNISRVTVYASSSNGLAEAYYDAAARLGAVLGRAGLDIVYGGGGVGLMGAMADRALAEGAHVHGVIPGFLNTLEHGHGKLPRLDVVADMRERKQRMIEGSDAVISLPGGSGTLEELFEVITLKRLGQFLGPILLSVAISGTMTFFAIPLSWFRQASLGAALGQGMKALVANWRPMLLLGLGLFAAFLPFGLLMLLFMQIVAIGGLVGTLGLGGVMLTLLGFQLLLFGTQYCSFRDIFGLGEKGKEASPEEPPGDDGQLLA